MTKRIAEAWFMDQNNNNVGTCGFVPPDINIAKPFFKIQADPRPPLHPDADVTEKKDRNNKKSKNMEKISDFQQHKRMKSETGSYFDHIKKKPVEDTLLKAPLDTLYLVKEPTDTMYYVDEIKNKTEDPLCTTQPTESGTGVNGYIEPDTIQPSPAFLQSEEEILSNKDGRKPQIFAYKTVDGLEEPFPSPPAEKEGFDEPYIFNYEKPKRQ